MNKIKSFAKSVLSEIICRPKFGSIKLGTDLIVLYQMMVKKVSGGLFLTIGRMNLADDFFEIGC